LDLGWFYPLIGLHVLNAFFCFMLLIALRSDFCEAVNCILARAGYVAIVAGFMWLIAAFLLYLIRKKEAEMSTNPNGVDLKDIEADREEMLALPPSEEPRLALPAPGDDKRKKKKKAPSSREVPLALPPSESDAAAQNQTPKSKPRKSVQKSPVSSSNRSSMSDSKSPRKSTKSPKKGAPTSPTSAGTKKKKKKKPAGTKPDDIPEI
jgi:hypothetical protein